MRDQDWRTFLGHRHRGRRLNSRAAFRSRLLQFTLIFTHRHHQSETWTTRESLAELREQNENRAKYWNEQNEQAQHRPALCQPFDQHKEFPLSQDALHANRSRLASTLRMPPDQRRWVTDIDGTPSLQCLLPLFVELTAAKVDLDNDWLPTSAWFELVGQFMLQAVVEEFLHNGAQGEESFNTAFAFGCPSVEHWAEEPSMVTAMRSLFCDENDSREQSHDWTDISTRYINEVSYAVLVTSL